LSKTQTDKSRYASRYAPGTFVTAAQWLAEWACEREAAAAGKELSRHFWKDPVWEKKYLRQLRAAQGLLKLYSPRAVGNALRGKEGKRVRSLGAPWLDDLVRAEQAKLDAAESFRQEGGPPPAPDGPRLPDKRPAFKNKPSLLDRLKESDGEE
jgi:hypothetical protein